MRHFDLAAIGDGLIVADAREELEKAIQGGVAVITAPPGTGKTTFVPPLVASILNDSSGLRTLLTQPRRVAVRAATNRISALNGSKVGSTVGYTVRGERRVGTDTALEILTPGVLLRRLLSDPELSGVGAVILDEVHERSVDGDLLLGMLAEVRALRDDLVLIAMSATLDASAIADLLGGAAVVEIPSALHPLRIDYAPARGHRLDERGVTREYLSHLARTAVNAQATQGCDALVFVPGAREVDETVRLIQELTRAAGSSVEALALHGRLSSAEQDRAVSGRSATDPPRIVVSTSLAESSLTVPGVRLVIDAGLSREIRRDRSRDMTGLVTVSASRASAEQRAGRAARQGPGVTIRAYSEAEFARMVPAAPPEIASADLTDAALILAEWGTPEALGLRLLTPPPAASLTVAVDVLRALDLITLSGSPTKLGSQIAYLPIGAREARALLEGATVLGDPALAAEIVAALSSDLREPSGDAELLLRGLRRGEAHGAARWRSETSRLARIAVEGVGGSATAARSTQLAAGRVIALARPEWIARRTGPASRSYLLASGTRAAAPAGSSLAEHEWIAVREVQRAAGAAADGTGAVIRLAAPLNEDLAVEVGRPLLSERRTARIDGGKVRVRSERALGAIVLNSLPAAATQADTALAISAHIAESGLEALPWTETSRALRARLALIHDQIGAPWPDVRDEALLGRLDDWLGADLARLSPSSGLKGLDLTSALRRLLPWPAASDFEALAPERLAVPSGSRVQITYPDPGSDDARPIVAVKLQEMFGQATTPRIVLGRVPVLFHLLSPARQPLAVTDDLASFWNGPYLEVRKEMRGRYPKHPWPEDPWAAQATARTTRASQRAARD